MKYIFLIMYILASTTSPFCETRLCRVMGFQQCIPPIDICDGENFCDDGTDENGELFPDIERCRRTSSRVEINFLIFF